MACCQTGTLAGQLLFVNFIDVLISFLMLEEVLDSCHPTSLSVHTDTASQWSKLPKCSPCMPKFWLNIEFMSCQTGGLLEQLLLVKFIGLFTSFLGLEMSLTTVTFLPVKIH